MLTFVVTYVLGGTVEAFPYEEYDLYRVMRWLVGCLALVYVGVASGVCVLLVKELQGYVPRLRKSLAVVLITASCSMGFQCVIQFVALAYSDYFDHNHVPWHVFTCIDANLTEVVPLLIINEGFRKLYSIRPEISLLSESRDRELP